MTYLGMVKLAATRKKKSWASQHKGLLWGTGLGTAAGAGIGGGLVFKRYRNKVKDMEEGMASKMRPIFVPEDIRDVVLRSKAYANMSNTAKKQLNSITRRIMKTMKKPEEYSSSLEYANELAAKLNAPGALKSLAEKNRNILRSIL